MIANMMNHLEKCGAFKRQDPLDPSVHLFNDAPAIHYDAKTDTFSDTHGCVFRQLFQDWPLLRPLYTDFEVNFNAWGFVNFAERYMHTSFIICAVYLLFCLVGQKVMAGREPFKLKGALQLWNLLLSVFSFIGFIRTAPHLLNAIYQNGFYFSICAPAEPSFGLGASGFWTMLFIYSKVPELIDTVFIVLRKNTLIFLHWYHHVTVLLYCWHSYSTRSSAGLYFAAANYGVHALMYFYYFLSARGIKSSWAGLVTFLQIAQMFLGMGICSAVAYYQMVANKPCDMTKENLLSGSVMYASYAALFIAFAGKKYFTGKTGFEKAPKKVDGPAPAAAKEDAAAAKKDDGLRKRK